jgi:hypothetical protein
MSEDVIEGVIADMEALTPASEECNDPGADVPSDDRQADSDS